MGFEVVLPGYENPHEEYTYGKECDDIYSHPSVYIPYLNEIGKKLTTRLPTYNLPIA